MSDFNAGTSLEAFKKAVANPLRLLFGHTESNEVEKVEGTDLKKAEKPGYEYHDGNAAVSSEEQYAMSLQPTEKANRASRVANDMEQAADLYDSATRASTHAAAAKAHKEAAKYYKDKSGSDPSQAYAASRAESYHKDAADYHSAVAAKCMGK